MGSAFIHSTVCQSTALTAHHPNKGEHVCGFHSSQQKLPLEARCLRPHEALSLFIPVTFHQEGEKRCLKGIRGKNDLQSPRVRQAHSMPRPPSLQRNKRYSGRPETPTTWLQWGWQGRLNQEG